MKHAVQEGVLKGIICAVVVALTPAAALAQPSTYADMYRQLVPGPVGVQPGGGINPYGQYAQPRVYAQPAPPVYYAPPPAPVYVAPATGYGEISPTTGLPRTDYVKGYTRSDGTYVQPYYRSHR